MKSLIGIDSQGQYKHVLHLFNRLRFSSPTVSLIHSASPVLPFAPLSYISGSEAQTDYTQVVQDLGEAALEEASSYAESLGLVSDKQMLLGSPADVLSREAEATGADLVCLTTVQRSGLSATFLGSVSRSLAIGCKASLLIAKGDVAADGPVTAVLATDHSEQAQRWIEHFISLGARGISKIHVLTAYQLDEHEARLLQQSVPVLGPDVDQWIEDRLGEKNAELVQLLQSAGYEADGRSVNGSANAAIRETMEQTKADLLVLGAQGHGFIERLLIGSTSLHQVVTEAYPVMVVRPPSAE